MVLLASAGCAASPGGSVRGQAIAEWEDATLEDLRPGVRRLEVVAGEVVRVEAAAPIEVGRSGDGTAELWRTLPAGRHELRVPFASTSFLVRGEARVRVVRSFVELGEIESALSDWERAPFGVAPAIDEARLDVASMKVVDRELERASASQSDAARALRTLLARRIAHRMARNARPDTVTREPVIGGVVQPDRSITFRMRGPGLLDVRVRGAVATLSERGRTRASGRRLEHVLPPGDVELTLATDAPAEVDGVVVRAIPTLAGALFAQTEESLGARAKRACSPDAAAPMACALSHAILGTDDAPTSDRWLGYADAMAQAPADLRGLVRVAAAGFDPAVRSRAPLLPDPTELAAMHRALGARADSPLTRAWAAGLEEATGWVPTTTVADAADGPRLHVEDRAVAASCAVQGEHVGSASLDVATTRFRASPALLLQVSADCTESRPVVLEVDGVTMSVQPTAPSQTWTVLTREARAKVRVVDAAGTEIRVLSPSPRCAPLPSELPGTLLAESTELRFDGPTGRGLELWMPEALPEMRAELTNGAERMTIELRRDPFAPSALDADGRAYRRAGRLVIPDGDGRTIVTGGAGLFAVPLARRATPSDASTTTELTSLAPPISSPYGIEPAFDRQQRRCRLDPTSPRARLAALDLRAKKPSDEEWDLIDQYPEDPRAVRARLTAAGTGRWKEIVLGPAARVPRTIAPLARDPRNVPAAAATMDRAVVVSAARPARFTLHNLDPSVSPTLEVACAPRLAAASKDPCALELVSEPRHEKIVLDDRGRAKVALSSWRSVADVRVNVADSPAKHVATVRVTLDKPTTGSVRTADGKHVLAPPSVDRRFLLEGTSARFAATAGPIRIDVFPETPGASVTVTTGKTRRQLGLGPHLIPESDGAILVAATGTSTFSLYERAPMDPSGEPAAEPLPEIVAVVPPPAKDAPAAGEREGLLYELGTWTVAGAALARTDREGSFSDVRDTVLQQSATWRRAFAPVGLFTSLGVMSRERTRGNPTFGGRAAVFEQIPTTPLRIAASAEGYAQRIVDQDVTTLRPRGHVELVLSASERVHLLPRVGVDGFTSNARALSLGRLDVDDGVWTLTRAQRPLWTTGQLLGVVLPARELALYARPRVVFDAASGSLVSTGGRASGVLSIGRVDFGGAAEATRWEAIPLVLREATWHTRVSGYAVGSVALGPSVLIEPGARASLRIDEARWEAHAFVSLVLSHGRDKSDHSKEDFAGLDEFAGTIAWRGRGQSQ